jgi:hypothetical protein
MTEDSDLPGSGGSAKSESAPGPSREELMAAIKARADALRAAKGRPVPSGTPPEQPAAATPAVVETPRTPAAPTDVQAPGEPVPTATREDKLAAIKARAEALRAARAAGGAAAAASVAASTAPTKVIPAPPSPDVFVSSLNPGGRPGAPPRAPALEAFGTISQSVEIRGEASEDDNLKKLLGGLGAYQNPLRAGAWQIDYRYYREAKARLEAAGYTIAERDFLGRPIADWSPASRGWTRVES